MPAFVHAPPVPAHRAALTLRERLLLTILYIAVLASSIAIIEPSPHDGLMGILAVTAVVTGVRFRRGLIVPLLLLIIWNASGLIAVINVLDQEKTLQYGVTSVYLGVAGLLFACIFSDNTMQRLNVMRMAYIGSAVLAAVLGIMGYFNIAGTGVHFAPTGRALGAFKDPNVYAPFLIWPALILIEPMLSRRIKLFDLGVLGIILMGLLLGFSRGAWFHFVLSAFVMVMLCLVTSPSPKTRFRILLLTAIAVALMAAALVVALSFESIATMFKERAQLIKSYDVGSGGRFRLQELALGAMFDYPLGLGPFEFARIAGLQQHNVYLQGFLVYGWAGAMAYILLCVSTVWVGLRSSFTRSPWQAYAIATFATFFGEVVEGFIIDTDHWRHWFLLLGITWGIWAANLTERRRAMTGLPSLTR